MIRVAAVLIVIASLFAGCKTTPRAVLTGGIVELQLNAAMRANADKAIDAGIDESEDWARQVAKGKVDMVEAKLTDPAGMVDLARYKADIDAIAGKLAETIADYERQRTAQHSECEARYREYVAVSDVIQRYQNAHGVSPETMQQIADTIGQGASVYKEWIANAAAGKKPEQTFQEKLQAMLGQASKFSTTLKGIKTNGAGK